MTRHIFLSSLLLLLIFSCRKDSEIIEVSVGDLPIPKIFVKASLGGVVTDEYGQPIVDARVWLENEWTTTNEIGVFYFQNKLMNSKAAYVRVEHPGYFHASRSISVAVGTQNTVQIRMMSNEIIQTISASNGGTVRTPDFSISLPAGGVASLSGDAFDGEVGVAARWLDPTDPLMPIFMPGNLTGIDANGRLTGLISMGMLAVELKENNGNPLKIKPGFLATISMRVPDALLPKAPKTIPLWHFDEQAGIWKEDGTATLDGKFYIGQVSHFSFWNCDYPAPLVEMTFEVKDQIGNPVPYAQVRLSVKDESMFVNGIANDLGIVRGWVPKDKLLDVKVFVSNLNCTKPVFESIIGPFSTDGKHVLQSDLKGLLTYEIKGKLSDCDGNAVTKGFVVTDTFIHWLNDAQSGAFSIKILSCQSISELRVVGYDLNNFQSETKYAEFGMQNHYEFDDFRVCGQLHSYILYEFGNESIFWDTLYVQSVPSPQNHQIIDSLTVIAIRPYCEFSLKNISGVGEYESSQFVLQGIYNGNSIFHRCANNSNCLKFQIKEWGGFGKYASGSFSGEVWTSNSTFTTVSGVFRFKVK